jgi:hypothetical protein
MLCWFGFGLKRFRLYTDFLASEECGLESGKLSVGFQAAEALRGFEHRGAGPAQRHPGVTPALHVAADASESANQVLDDVRARQRTSELGRQAEAVDGQDSSRPSRMLAATPGASGSSRRARFRISRSALSASGKFPRLPERPAHRRAQVLRQPLQDPSPSDGPGAPRPPMAGAAQTYGILFENLTQRSGPGVKAEPFEARLDVLERRLDLGISVAGMAVNMVGLLMVLLSYQHPAQVSVPH